MKHAESQLQRACVKWFRYQHRELAKNLISIPNGYQTTPTQANIAKAEGIVSGASDLFLFMPNKHYSGLAIEMKTPKGRQSENQKEWQWCVEKVGYKYVICRSIEEFIQTIHDYLLDI